MSRYIFLLTKRFPSVLGTLGSGLTDLSALGLEGFPLMKSVSSPREARGLFLESSVATIIARGQG